MIALHVWGADNKISIISPGSLACAWFVQLVKERLTDSIEIVTSNNTNLADGQSLPLLIDASNARKIEGFYPIIMYICENLLKEADVSPFIQPPKMNKKLQLIERTIISHIENHLHLINQYNLYICTTNYEKYTRKLFANYLPFPMMYNQPLKFYNKARDEVKMTGIGIGRAGFFSITGSEEVAETEYFNDAISDDETTAKPISKLHERQLLKKSKDKQTLRETRNTLRAMNLLGDYVGQIYQINRELHEEDSQFGSFIPDAISANELLLFAYINSICSEDLPDRFLKSYLEKKYPDFFTFCKKNIQELNDLLVNSSLFRSPREAEPPSLFNEIRYWTGFVKY